MANTYRGLRQGRKDENVYKNEVSLGNFSFIWGWNPGIKDFKNLVTMSTIRDDADSKKALKVLLGGKSLLAFLARVFMKLAGRLTTFDKRYHVDVVADATYSDGTHKVMFFDVKDVDDGNIGTGNYTIGKDDKEYCLNDRRKSLQWFAFRLNSTEGGRLNTFAVLNAKEALKEEHLAGRGGDTCYSLVKMWNGCRQRFVVGDKEDMERFLKSHGQTA